MSSLFESKISFNAIDVSEIPSEYFSHYIQFLESLGIRFYRPGDCPCEWQLSVVQFSEAVVYTHIYINNILKFLLEHGNGNGSKEAQG